MGLFSYFETDETRRAAEVRAGAVAPSRTERKRCWDSRDLYFACLDNANIVDAIKDDKAARRACPTQSTNFEADCAKEWVCISSAMPKTITRDLLDRHTFIPTQRTCRNIGADRPSKVKYFKQWRVADHQKRQRIRELESQGGTKMDVSSSFTTVNPPTTSVGTIQEQLASRRK